MNLPIYTIQYFAFLLAILLSLGATNETIILNILMKFKNLVEQELNRQINSAYNKEVLKKQHKAARQLKTADTFPCNLENLKLRSDTEPQNVNQIRPGDIDIIAAMGDSLSIGTGISAVDVVQVLFAPQRGRTWSAGGEKTWRSYLTLPNILKVFNPKLFGFSLSFTQNSKQHSQFNVAKNGAKSRDMPNMAKELVRRIKQDARVDLKNHWKMVTLMIGDNDFCSEICFLRHSYDSLIKHREDLIATLKHLKDNLPRTIVNIVPPPRLDILYEMRNLPGTCKLVQTIACPCIRHPLFLNQRKIISDIMVKWQQVDLEVSNLPEFHSEDFTVISHTFTLNYTFPRTRQGNIDYSFLAPDCFHYSENGQGRFANDIWNSLLEPYGNKSTDGTPIFSKFNCPSEQHPYIYTKGNSI